jgi:hypothetical protein
MYRWLEAYERKHTELWRVIERYRHDTEVWVDRASRQEERIKGLNGGEEELIRDLRGAATFARMQAAMYRRLRHNAQVIFKSAESGAHHDWVSASTFDDLVAKVDRWRDKVFKWMDDMVCVSP